MITMTTLPVTAERGTHPGVEGVAPAYARAWKPRPSVVVILGGFGTDNSTGVSAEECRRL
jgi:hypothetical protein